MVLLIYGSKLMKNRLKSQKVEPYLKIFGPI